MKINVQVENRLRDMLTKDKLSAGFMTAFKSDLLHLVRDYFDTDGVDVSVNETKDGTYLISITATAQKINSFETTVQKRF